MKSTKSHSRKGDIAELKAVTFLLEKGYEVFRNCGCDGPVDIVAIDEENNVSLIDVKCAQPQLHKKTGNNVTKCNSRSKEQIDMGVKILQFNAKTRKLRFINHTK